MNIPHLPFTVTDWAKIPGTDHPGDSGKATWRTLEAGDLRVRMVEYSPGYVADHWCPRGHVLLVVEGEVEVELKDGQRHALKPGMGYVASDDPANPHRSNTRMGCKLFIVD